MSYLAVAEILTTASQSARVSLSQDVVGRFDGHPGDLQEVSDRSGLRFLP
jgi:hypothetical protein